MADLENLTRRGFLALSLAGAISLACKDKHHRPPIDTDNPSTPDTGPGPNPQQDFHHFSGTIKDTDGNLISGARVNLRVRNSFTTYGADSVNGNYRIPNVPNGDYVLTLENIPGFFGYEDPIKIISAQGEISKNFFLISASQRLLGTTYRNLLDMLKDVTENNDGRDNDPADSVQKVRRFDLATRIKVFLGTSPPLGYAAKVQEALSDWATETGLSLFETTTDQRQANVEFSYSPNGQSSRTDILSQETVNSVGIIKKARITLDTSLTLTNVRRYSSRELGFVLLNAKRGSRDDLHIIFKDANNPNNLLSTGITDDEAKVVQAYYGLPIGEKLNPYRS